MYAPNTYNGGYEDNVSSISEKSEAYSNVSPDFTVSTIDVVYSYKRHKKFTPMYNCYALYFEEKKKIIA